MTFHVTFFFNFCLLAFYSFITLTESMSVRSFFCPRKKMGPVFYVSEDAVASIVLFACGLAEWTKEGPLYSLTSALIWPPPEWSVCYWQCLGMFEIKELSCSLITKNKVLHGL